MSSGGVIVTASNNCIFSNALIGDMLIFTNSNSQKLLIGNNSNSVANLTLTSNVSYFSSGNVGIGKSNPQTTLDVNGNVTAANFIGNANTSSNLTGYPNINATSINGYIITPGPEGYTPSPTITFQPGGNYSYAGLQIYTGDYNINHLGWGSCINSYNTNVGVSNTMPLRICGNPVYFTSNVGIGTTNPTTSLDVTGASTLRGAVTVTGNLYIPNSTSVYINNIQKPQANYVGTSGSFGLGYIRYESKIIDTTNSYNTSTGLFTSPVQGLYMITASVWCGTNTNMAVIAIFKNGGPLYTQPIQTNALNANGCIAGGVFLNVGETVGIYNYYTNNQYISVDASHAIAIFLVN